MPPMVLLPLVDQAMSAMAARRFLRRLAADQRRALEADKLRVGVDGTTARAAPTGARQARRHARALARRCMAMRRALDAAAPETGGNAGAVTSKFRMSAPTAVIAEDEPLLRGELREMLAAQWPELAICAEVEDGTGRLHALSTSTSPTSCSSTSRCRA